MKKFATLMAAAALMGAASFAYAEPVTATVTSFDAATLTIELDNGATYAIQPGVDTSGLEAGAVVTLNVESVGGSDMVTEVAVN